MWKVKEINVGGIKPGQSVKAVFEYDTTHENVIERIVPGCGCTDFIHDKDKGQLAITLNIKIFPKHLKMQGSINVKKNINIYYVDIPYPEVLYISGQLLNL